MDPITIGLIASGVLAAGGGLLSFFGAKKQSRTNQQIASQNVQAQQRENEITREREDNAVQRRARDLELAGLSKTLAAGSAASSQALTAPKNEFQAQNLGQAALQGITQGTQIAQQVAQVQQTQAQTQNLAAQTKYQELKNASYEEDRVADLNLKRSQTNLNYANTKIAQIVGENKQRMIDKEIEKMSSEVAKNNASGIMDIEHANLFAEQAVTELKQRGLIDKQIEKYVQDIAYEQVRIDTAKHDLGIAESHNNPSNYNYALRDSVLASSAINAGSNIASGLLKALISAGNYSSSYPSNISLSF